MSYFDKYSPEPDRDNHQQTQSLISKTGIAGGLIGLIGIFWGIYGSIFHDSPQTPIALDKIRATLEKQIKISAEALKTAEDRLSDYRATHPTLVVAPDNHYKLEEKRIITEQLRQLTSKRSEVADYFTPQHPAVHALDDKIAILQQKEIMIIPSPEKETIIAHQEEHLSQELAVQREIYVNRLARLQDLAIVEVAIQDKPLNQGPSWVKKWLDRFASNP